MAAETRPDQPLPGRGARLSPEERLARFEALARALSVARSVAEVAEVTAREASLAVGALAAFVMAAASGDHARLELVAHHDLPARLAEAYRSLRRDGGLPICKSFEHASEEWLDHAEYVERYRNVVGTRIPRACSHGIASLPLVVDGRVVAALGLRFAEQDLPTTEERAFVRRLVDLCAQAFERARLYETERAARAAAERRGIVLEAGDAVARAGDRETVLSRLTEAVVPRVADACFVYLAEGEGRARLVRTATTDCSDGALGCAFCAALRDGGAFGGALQRPNSTSYEDLAIVPELGGLRALGVTSLLVAPLATADRTIGAVVLASRRAELRYSATDRVLAEKLASRVAFALENARLIGELRAAAETERAARRAAQGAAVRMRMLAEASSAFTEARLDARRIATSLAGLVTTHVADACSVVLVAEDGEHLEPIALRHASTERQRAAEVEIESLRVGEGLLGRVIATGDAVVLHADDPNREARLLPAARAPVASLAIVPLRLGGRIIGAVGADRTDGPNFDPEDMSMLQDLADRVAIALANARLHAAEQTARKHVERLQSVTSALGEAILPEQVADVILDSAVQELGGDLAVFYEPNAEGDALVGRRQRNVPEHLARAAAHLDLDRPDLAAAALHARAPLFVETIEQYRQRFPSAASSAKPWLDLGAFAVLPLVVGSSQIHAIVAIGFRAPRAFSAVDRAFAMNLAEQSAQALERARLYAAERAAKREAEAASRLKDEFLATVSHELRTPLNAILGWASLLRAGRIEQDALEHALETIERNARAQARLVDDVLDVSRIISGKLAIRAEPVDVALLLEQAIDVIRPAASAKDLAVECSIEPHLVVRGDADRLKQVYWNVLSNAVKFTPRDGRVSIIAERREGVVSVRVSDTGLGIRPDFLGHLFEPFRQADGSITRGHGGLGLGLSIARHLVQLHGGDISAESGGEGHGATFTVTVPATGGEPKLDGAGRQRPAARLLGLDVLVVDDDEDARELAAMILSAEGAEVRTASSARRALAAIDARSPEILLCDIGMPEEDGLSFLPRARAAAGGAFRAIAFTAYADAQHVELVAQAGFDAHLTKPVDAQSLVAAIARLAGPATSSSAARRG